MRIAIAQVNSILGDFEFNTTRVIEEIRRAKERRCDLVVFPESIVFGYHPFDLLERRELVEQQEKYFQKIVKAMPAGIAAIVGLFTLNPGKKGRPYFNSAALIEKGKKAKLFHKQLLPTGDVFDEARFIESGDLKKNFFSYKGTRFFLTICEDIWAWPDSEGRSIYRENPIASIKGKKVDCVINLSASPFYPGKDQIRRRLVQKTAKHFGATMLYCNLVGAQDEIIFDGGSFALDKKGKEICRCLEFEEDFAFFDLEENEGSLRPQVGTDIDRLRRALVLGIADFCRKTGFKKVHLGLSGGIDSAVVAALLTDALGPANVKALYLPTEFSAKESGDSARQLAENLGIEYQVIPIQGIFEDLRGILDSSFAVDAFVLAHENLQSRIRGMTLMFQSNLSASLLIGTSNKSELASGYATLYGDLCAGLLPIGDLSKQEVVALAKEYNRESEVIPQFIIERPPSAELRPNQKDQDSLPPYEDLDRAVIRVVEDCAPIRTDLERWVLKALMRSEFKRWQAPPILKVAAHSFGRGRRWPVAHRSQAL